MMGNWFRESKPFDNRVLADNIVVVIKLNYNV